MKPIDPPAFGTVEPGVAYVDRPCAFGVALRGGKVLVVDTPKGLTLPGGGLDAGETHAQALVREILEEIGHAARVGAFLGEAAQFTRDPMEGVAYRKIARFHRVTLGPRQAPPSEPDHTCRWLPVAEAAASMAGGAFAWAIRRAAARRAG